MGVDMSGLVHIGPLSLIPKLILSPNRALFTGPPPIVQVDGDVLGDPGPAGCCQGGGEGVRPRGRCRRRQGSISPAAAPSASGSNGMTRAMSAGVTRPRPGRSKEAPPPCCCHASSIMRCCCCCRCSASIPCGGLLPPPPSLK